VQPVPAVPPRAEIVAAVRDVMREDRDGDGVPDVLARPPQPQPQPQPQPPRPRSAPSSSQHAVFIGLGVMVMCALGAVTALLVMAPSERTPPKVKAAPVVTTPAPVPSPPVATSGSALPAALPSTATTGEKPATPAKPVPKLTNEQYGKNVVAGRNKELLRCVEQDLLRNPDAAKAYTVTVLVERDGAPRNSATTFSPKPSRGFQDCAKFAIFYGFTKSGRNPPQLVEFTFTTSFAFPNAKPAAKADPTWD